MNRLTIDEFKSSAKVPLIIVLDNIRSQNNVGSVFRTADAFRVEAIYLCGITATPPHREINKTALGATDSVSWKYFPETSSPLNPSIMKDIALSVSSKQIPVFLCIFFILTKRKNMLLFLGMKLTDSMNV